MIGREVRVRHKLWIQVELMSGEWINGQERDHIGLWILDMTNVLDCLFMNFVLSWGWSKLSWHVAHAPHDNVHVDVLKLFGNTIGLGNHELVSKELVDSHLALLAQAWFLWVTKLLWEDDVITNLLTDWLLNLVTLKLKQLVFDNIVLLEFVPIFFSFIE